MMVADVAGDKTHIPDDPLPPRRLYLQGFQHCKHPGRNQAILETLVSPFGY